jgi:hypothetical protein
MGPDQVDQPRRIHGSSRQLVSVTFSVIIPTGGERAAQLKHAIGSISPQLEHGDEIIVTRFDCPWGHRARNLAIPRCAGTHLMFCDDDDSYAPDALLNVRKEVALVPDRVHVFAMTYGDGRVLTANNPPGYGSVGTPMMVIPNNPEKMGRWDEIDYAGDWRFFESTMEHYPELPPVLHTVSIARVGW